MRVRVAIQCRYHDMSRWENFIKKIERSIQMMRIESISIMDIDHDTTVLLLTLHVISHHMNLNVSPLFSLSSISWKSILLQNDMSTTNSRSINNELLDCEKWWEKMTWRQHKQAHGVNMKDIESIFCRITSIYEDISLELTASVLLG